MIVVRHNAANNRKNNRPADSAFPGPLDEATDAAVFIISGANVLVSGTAGLTLSVNVENLNSNFSTELEPTRVFDLGE